MCKKLLLVVTLLSFVSFASAGPLIEDFESYWGTADPAFQAAWPLDNSAGNSSAISIVPGYNSPQAMQMDATYANADYSGVRTAMNFTPVLGGKLHMTVRLLEGADWSTLNQMVIQYSGVTCDGKGGTVNDWAQTWIVGDQEFINGWAAYWMPVSTVPATIGNSGTTAPNAGGTDYPLLPRITPANGWMEIVIGDDQLVSWSDVSRLSAFDVPVGEIALQMWGTSGQVFTAQIDNVRYDILPEPAAIAMLGLGGLAVLRKRR